MSGFPKDSPSGGEERWIEGKGEEARTFEKRDGKIWEICEVRFAPVIHLWVLIAFFTPKMGRGRCVDELNEAWIKKTKKKKEEIDADFLKQKAELERRWAAGEALDVAEKRALVNARRQYDVQRGSLELFRVEIFDKDFDPELQSRTLGARGGPEFHQREDVPPPAA